MNVLDLLRDIVRGQHSGVEARKLDHAIEVLEKHLVRVDVELKDEPSRATSLGSLVSVPGTPGVWVVFGVWGDGTYDIIREGETTAAGRLIGWKPGQSLVGFEMDLDVDCPDEEPTPVSD
jgi:hypothetical protein